MKEKRATFQLIPLSATIGILTMLLTHSMEGGMNGFQGYLFGFIGTIFFVVAIELLSQVFHLNDIEKRRQKFDELLNMYQSQLERSNFIKGEEKSDLLSKFHALRQKGSLLK